MADRDGRGCCVIMAGGRGTRFWPLSRRQRPKQLLPLASDRSLLRETFERVAPLVGPQRVLVITSGDLAAPTAAELPELPAANVIAEPVGRNTAPCAVLGMGIAARLAPGQPVALLPADHLIPDDGVFREQLAAAFARADEAGGVVTFGIPPTRPETGYGYLEVGPPAEHAPDDLRPGVAFVEKPDRARAEQYLLDGCHLWNSGIFVWSAGAFARAVVTHIPDVVERLAPAIAAHGTAGFPAALESAYEDCPAESIDYAVMEKLPSFEVMEARYGWSDLGSWSAWGDLAPELPDAGRGMGQVVGLDSADNVVHAPDKLVALIGVRDLVVVDTGDALLICPRSSDQKVKEVLARLEADRREDLL
ncbi:NTP transferase domain-containing protein [bacterium]|nr:NTP transferase domain-containing protein [bacterium]